MDGRHPTTALTDRKIRRHTNPTPRARRHRCTYRRAGATDHAAAALRQSTINKLIPLLGLTSDATPEAVTHNAQARVGRDVHAVLYGPPPATEQALVDLADELDRLADEIGSL